MSLEYALSDCWVAIFVRGGLRHLIEVAKNHRRVGGDDGADAEVEQRDDLIRAPEVTSDRDVDAVGLDDFPQTRQQSLDVLWNDEAIAELAAKQELLDAAVSCLANEPLDVIPRHDAKIDDEANLPDGESSGQFTEVQPDHVLAAFFHRPNVRRDVEKASSELEGNKSLVDHCRGQREAIGSAEHRVDGDRFALHTTFGITHEVRSDTDRLATVRYGKITEFRDVARSDDAKMRRFQSLPQIVSKRHVLSLSSQKGIVRDNDNGKGKGSQEIL